MKKKNVGGTRVMWAWDDRIVKKYKEKNACHWWWWTQVWFSSMLSFFLTMCTGSFAQLSTYCPNILQLCWPLELKCYYQQKSKIQIKCWVCLPTMVPILNQINVHQKVCIYIWFWFLAAMSMGKFCILNKHEGTNYSFVMIQKKGFPFWWIW